MTIFDPADLFSLAQSLLGSTDTEASHRTIIGRVYYSCHLTARDQMYGIDGIGLTKSVKRKLGTNGDHEAVIRAIPTVMRVTQSKAKRLADQLGQLREMRESADYLLDSGGTQMTSVFAKHKVSSWLDLAKAAMALGSNLLPELRRL